MDISSLLLADLSSFLAQQGEKKTLLVGISGGADSVALLCLLNTLKQAEHFSLHAVHVSHGLRESGKRDEQFVCALCTQLSVPCHVYPVTVKTEGSVENNARIARYQAFETAYKKVNADLLLLAHHMDDQAETVLLHLLYGTGLQGVRGMRTCCTMNGMHIVRPLLRVSRSQIIDYLKSVHQPFMEDETNGDTCFTRNFLRHDILAPINQRMHNASNNIARFAQIAEAEDDYLYQTTQILLQKYAVHSNTNIFLKKEVFAQLHLALKRRLIKQFLSPYIEIDFSKTEEIIHCLPYNRKVVNLSHKASLLILEHNVHLVFEDAPSLPLDKERMLTVSKEMTHFDGKRAQAFPLSLFQNAVFRYKQKGDFIIPFSKHQKVSLKEYLIDKKVDLPFRQHLPLLAVQNEVLMVFGVGASEKLRLTAHQENILVTLRTPFPWEDKNTII